MKKPKIGSSWRFSANDPKHGTVELKSSDTYQCPMVRIGPGTVFDELVIDIWFHMEQMDDNLWWMRIGEQNVMITIDKKTRNVKLGEWY